MGTVKTSKSQTLCYTGQGANKSFLHTPSQLENIYTSICNPEKELCPNNESEWIQWMGAIRTTVAGCKAIARHNRKVSRAAEAADKVVENYRNCVQSEGNITTAAVTCSAKQCSKEEASYNKIKNIVIKI